MKVKTFTQDGENLIVAMVLIGFMHLIIGSVIKKSINSINLWIIGYYFFGWILISTSITILYPLNIKLKLPNIKLRLMGINLNLKFKLKPVIALISSIILAYCSIQNL